MNKETIPFEFRQPGAQALLVTAEGEFIWHKDAESMIKNGDFSNSPSLRFIMQRLWSQGATMNEFNPDWDAMAVMVEEQQRMAKRIEDLEALLERQTARIVDLQTHIENLEGEE